MRTHTKITLGVFFVLGCIATFWWLRRGPASPVVAPIATTRAQEPAALEPEVANPPVQVTPVASTSSVALPVADSTALALTTTPPATDATVPQAAPAVAPNASGGDEVQGTRNMIMAHAPLRTREVADPDSATSRAILQSMISKALVRQNETQSLQSPSLNR